MMLNWLKRTFGRGSKVDHLIRALPNPSEILRNADAWARVLKDWGDRGAAWEPQDSRLLEVVRQSADALNLVGPFIGAQGTDKLAAITEQVRLAIATVGIADQMFDSFWASKGRPILEAYLSARRQA